MEKQIKRSGTMEVVATPQWEWETAFYISMTSSDIPEVARCLSIMRDLEENLTKKQLDEYKGRVLRVLEDKRKNG
jgi:hypothetical protein